ncbi:centromere protein P isoform X2 [Salarias fasciatus]|uniref:centromere protein P isoform X2 n=1 Tax=Salarias fasciatus TaxID=181472 RepID=UPI001176F0A6|nr:centromere protein P isoform X2 [Salarias fasciatus]
MMNEENIEMAKGLEAQISHFQAEIQALQRIKDSHKDMQFHFKGQMQDALAFLCGQRQGRKKESLQSRLKEEVEELKEDLRQQTEMNGIDLDRFTTKTLQGSDTKQVQQIRLSGRCSQLGFDLEFQVSENQGRKSERTISDVNVVLDSDDLHNFSSFISMVEETSDLLLFFRTMRTFSERCHDRAKAFQHFQEKYPAVVSLPGGHSSEVMTLNHPELPGCVLFLRWSVEVSRDGVVTPRFDLLTKIPEEALQLFPSPPIGGAAEAFHSLRELLGVEAAIESMIRAVSLSPDL